MTVDGTTLAQLPPLAGAEAEPIAGKARLLRLPRSPKVAAGLGVLALFGLGALIGRWIAPYSPNATDEARWEQHDLAAGTGPGTNLATNHQLLPLPPSAA